MPISLFVSYASEDQKLVDAIVVGLDTAFRRSLNIKYMSQFEPGIAFRKEIDDALDAADILLVVASGKEKLSHSFTGYEVGYFRKSQQTRPLITETPHVERLILPFAVVTDIPDTISEIQGVKISKPDQFFVHAGGSGVGGYGPQEAMYKLLVRLDQIINDKEQIRPDADVAAKTKTVLDSTAATFATNLGEVLRRIPITQTFPQLKFTMSIPPDFDPRRSQLNEVMSVSVFGPTKQLFPGTISRTDLTWSELEKMMGKSDVALNWRDAIEFLVSTSVSQDEFSYADQVMLSADEKSIFRLFVSKRTLYFDGTHEIDIYIVPVLRLGDAGDPVTTYLARAINVALRCRSLFLEPNSPYAKVTFDYETDDEKFLATARELLKELRILYVRGREAQLENPRNVALLFGGQQEGVINVTNMADEWKELKEALTKAVEKLLLDPKGRLSDTTKVNFLTSLQEFINAMRRMNTIYLKAVLTRLNAVLE
jgi:hypothetical protein